MRCLQVITGNMKKAEEYRAYAAAAGVELILEPRDMEIPEIQTDDARTLLMAKVDFVKSKTSLPFIIDDASFSSARYPGFPGNYTKFITKAAGTEGLRRLFDEGDAITATARIALHYLGETFIFEGSIDGTMTFEHAGKSGPRMPFNTLMFVPSEGKTLGEALADPLFRNHRRRAFDALLAFIADREREGKAEIAGCAARWNARADGWQNTVSDMESYVNHEDAYGRFNAMVEKYSPLIRGDVLDIGCGTGLVTRSLAEIPGVRAIGIDISPAMVAEAVCEVPTAHFEVGSVDLFRDKQRFDALVSRGIVLSFLPRFSVADYLRDATAIANPGAHFIFDFIQHAKNGGFASSAPLNEFTLAQIETIMRELGWVLVDHDAAPEKRLGIAVFHKPRPGTVYFASGNPRKFEELVAALGDVGRPLAFVRLQADEIKSDSLERTVADKLEKAFAAVRAPVICTDGGVFINALGGFPGEHSGHAAKKLGCTGLLKLLEGCDDRTAIRRNAIGYFDGERMQIRTNEVSCIIANAPLQRYPSYEFDRILVPQLPGNEDGRTYAEMPVKERVRFSELPFCREFITTALKENKS